MPNDNTITLVFYGGDADKNRLDLYDASASYYGLARTLAILGHYYVKKEIIAQAPRSAMPLYIVPPEEGSFKQTIIAAAVGGIVGAPFGVFSERVLNSWIPQPNSEMQEIIALLKEQNEILRAANGLPKKPTEKEVSQLKEVDQCIVTNQKELQTVRCVTSNSFKAIYRPIGRSADAAGIVSGAPIRRVRLSTRKRWR
ncbi:hypothetical protein [Hyphomicrobium sp.]|uniref:DUF7946 domain-containing protein n=1 Tax=Hyphomicrobium sp. TaxID=82 RepID=UPI000FA35B2D|nr:hypothetical protein [Hyphomicrobium sp.]RUP08290.1 MAG: hypothetical protein EKK38_15520 [Hyphomicrobium sp.]